MKKVFGLLILFFVAFSASGIRAQWVHISNPPGTSVISIASIGSDLFVATDTLVSRSNDNGVTWTILNTGLSNGWNVLLSSLKNKLFAGYHSGDRSITGGLLVTSDLGQTWTTVDTGAGFGIKAMSASGDNLYCGTDFLDNCDADLGGGIIILNDKNGDTAQFISMDTSSIRGPGVFAIGANGSTVLASTGVCYAPDYTVFQSGDFGTDWFHLNLPPLNASSFSFIGTTIFTGGYSGVFRSTDSSVSWNQINIGLQDTNVATLATTGNRLFAATPSGVFFSNDLGTRWKDMSEGLPAHPGVLSLLVNGNFLFAGTDSLGLWERPLTDFPPVVQSGVNPNRDQLATISCYPNPFSQSTEISLSSPDVESANVSIVNLIGQQVAQIYSGPLSLGSHSFIWSNPLVADGLYECVVRLNGNVQTIPIMLQR